MEKFRTKEEIGTSIWNDQLNGFLNFFDLKSEFTSSGKGIVEDKNNIICGKTELYSVMNKKEVYCLQTDVTHSYGRIRIRQDLGLSHHLLHFQINQDNSRNLSGSIVGERKGIGFAITNFEMYTSEKNRKIEKIAMMMNNKNFYYHNYETETKIGFLKKAIFNAWEGMVLTSHYKNENHEKVEMIVSSTEDNRSICSARTYNHKTNLDNEIEKMETNLPIYEQFQYAVGNLHPSYYREIETLVESYQKENMNIIKPALHDVLLPHLTLEQSECLLGREMVKKLTK